MPGQTEHSFYDELFSRPYIIFLCLQGRRRENKRGIKSALQCGVKNTFVCCALASFVIAISEPGLISYQIGEDYYGILGVAALFRRSAYLLLNGAVTVVLLCLAGSKSTIKHQSTREQREQKLLGFCASSSCISKKKRKVAGKEQIDD